MAAAAMGGKTEKGSKKSKQEAGQVFLSQALSSSNGSWAWLRGCHWFQQTWAIWTHILSKSVSVLWPHTSSSPKTLSVCKTLAKNQVFCIDRENGAFFFYFCHFPMSKIILCFETSFDNRTCLMMALPNVCWFHVVQWHTCVRHTHRQLKIFSLYLLGCV